MLSLKCEGYLKWFWSLLFLKSVLLFCNAGGAVFDASQYAFFGNDVVEEVELGGLEDEEDDVAPAGFEEEFGFEGEQVAFLSVLTM